mmetsp:Transcript_8723/g.18637  ORF Transcript_8723/g.18637 Transcript_8723/m.18637 type:complete len:414 (+) Transcript_8723:85-1326(+)
MSWILPFPARCYRKWGFLALIIGCIAVFGIIFSSVKHLSSYASIIHTRFDVSSQNSTRSLIYGGNRTEIDLVSLTVNYDFYVLFNNSAIDSWLRHIQHIRSITFVGPPNDQNLFEQKMRIHYNHLHSNKTMIPIRWVNETYWMDAYKEKLGCPYPAACQQLIKLNIFDLRTELGIDISDNVLIVDSDTVWSRDIQFIDPNNGKVTYFGIRQNKGCINLDPVEFTEAITAGIPPAPPENARLRYFNESQLAAIEREFFKKKLDYRVENTVTPYKSCRQTPEQDATGLRHIIHHMLFQFDVMTQLHQTINRAWNSSSIWEAAVECFRIKNYCAGRVAEYELYYSFLAEHYPERINVEVLKKSDVMLASAICDAKEMQCCRDQNVLLKGCHDHRINEYKENKSLTGDICCLETQGT